MNLVALSVVIVQVVVTVVLGTPTAKSVGNTQRKTLCKINMKNWSLRVLRQAEVISEDVVYA